MRELTPPLLYDVGYFLLRESSVLYKEQHDSMDHLDDHIFDLLWEDETGLPAIAQLVPPADSVRLPAF